CIQKLRFCPWWKVTGVETVGGTRGITCVLPMTKFPAPTSLVGTRFISLARISDELARRSSSYFGTSTLRFHVPTCDCLYSSLIAISTLYRPGGSGSAFQYTL